MSQSTKDQAVKDILKNHKLRLTRVRLKILNIFLDSSKALTHEDIESHFDQLDRITLYRTLKTFEESGLIHKIPSSDNTPLYAICAEDCNHNRHMDNHGHFHCLKCGKTYCMEEVKIPAIDLPDGYEASNQHLVMEGNCADCNE